MKKLISISLILVMLLSSVTILSATASEEAINVFGTNYVGDTNQRDFYVYHKSAPAVITGHGMEIVQWEWYQYDVTVPEAGLYEVSVKASINQASAAGATIRSEKTEINFPLTQTCDGGITVKEFSNLGYLYLDAGVNRITFENSGDLTAITDLNSNAAAYLVLHAMSFKKAADSNFDQLNQYVLANSFTEAEVPEGASVPDFAKRYAKPVSVEANATPEFTYKVNILRSGYYDIYLRASVHQDLQVLTFAIDGTSVKTGWLGHTWTGDNWLDCFLNKKLNSTTVYLSEGEHTIKYSGKNGARSHLLHSFIFDYVTTGEITVASGNTTKSGEDGSSVVGVDWYREGKTSFPTWGGNGGFEMTKGSWGRYIVTAPGDGIYAVSLRVGNPTGDNTMIVETETGCIVSYAVPKNSSDYWGKQCDNIGYVRLAKGDNIFTVTNEGPSHHCFWNASFRKVDDSYANQLKAADIVINPYSDYIPGDNQTTWYDSNANQTTPTVNSSTGVEAITGEWQTYKVVAGVAGYYDVSVNIGTAAATAITMETNGYKNVFQIPATATVTTFTKFNDLGQMYLKEGENIIWIRNSGAGWYYLKQVTLSPVETAQAVSGNLYIPAESYLSSDAEESATAKAVKIGYNTVKWGIGETLTYSFDVLKDGYYSIWQTGNVWYHVNQTIKIDGEEVRDLHIMENGMVEKFGGQWDMVTREETEKVYLTKGPHTMTVYHWCYEQHQSYIHGFELLEVSEEALALAAINASANAKELKEILLEKAEVLSINPAEDFKDVLDENYYYNALLNTYADIEAFTEAYNTVKETEYLIYEDDFACMSVTSIADKVSVGDTILVAVYRGGAFYTLASATVTNDVTDVMMDLDYIREANDTFRVFVWENLDNMVPCLK